MEHFRGTNLTSNPAPAAYATISTNSTISPCSASNHLAERCTKFAKSASPADRYRLPIRKVCIICGPPPVEHPGGTFPRFAAPTTEIICKVCKVRKVQRVSAKTLPPISHIFSMFRSLHFHFCSTSPNDSHLTPAQLRLRRSIFIMPRRSAPSTEGLRPSPLRHLSRVSKSNHPNHAQSLQSCRKSGVRRHDAALVGAKRGRDSARVSDGAPASRPLCPASRAVSCHRTPDHQSHHPAQKVQKVQKPHSSRYYPGVYTKMPPAPACSWRSSLRFRAFA